MAVERPASEAVGGDEKGQKEDGVIDGVADIEYRASSVTLPASTDVGDESKKKRLGWVALPMTRLTPWHEMVRVYRYNTVCYANIFSIILERNETVETERLFMMPLGSSPDLLR